MYLSSTVKRPPYGSAESATHNFWAWDWLLIQPGTILQYQTGYKQNIAQSLAAKLPLSNERADKHILEDETCMKELAS